MKTALTRRLLDGVGVVLLLTATVGCNALPSTFQPAASGAPRSFEVLGVRPAGSAAATTLNGRYVFYPERGFLLDTTTGDMWAMTQGDAPQFELIPREKVNNGIETDAARGARLYDELTKKRYYNPKTGELQDTRPR